MSTVTSKTQRFRNAAYISQGGKCYWCGAQMIIKTKKNASQVWNDPRVCTADHLEWQAVGGKTTRDNIVAACRDCNNKRHPPKKLWNGAVRYTVNGDPIVPVCYIPRYSK